MESEFCFCTLAVGSRYRLHARLLANDLQQHAPTQKFVVLTDRPADFSADKNVLPFEHQLTSVQGFHDKRFPLVKALSLFESCIFLDADMRVLGPVPQEIEFKPGITARLGCSMAKHAREHLQGTKELAVLQAVADELEVKIENINWLHEFMFFMRRQDGVETDFFEAWQAISYYFENRGIYRGACFPMGLAAAKSGLEFSYRREDLFPVFKDNIAKYKIEVGGNAEADTRAYLSRHKEIEFPNLSLGEKAIRKTKEKLIFIYRILRLRRNIKRDFEFQRLFGQTA